MSDDIKVGSKVKISKAYACCYYCYEEWVITNCPEYLPLFESGALYEDGTIGKVVCIAPYKPNQHNNDVYAVRTDSYMYLVMHRAMELVGNNFEVVLL